MSGQDSQGPNKIVLYAEDEEEVKDLTVQSLENRGLNVLSANNGEEAFELFSKNSDKIGVVLTDVVMPKMSGKVLFDKVREVSPHLGFVFVSGYSRRELSRDEGGLPKNTRFFSKPFDTEEVVSTLREFMKETHKGD